MSNNNLYILDPQNHRIILVGKSYASGWSWNITSETLFNWINEMVCDEGASYGACNTFTNLKFITDNEIYSCEEYEEYR